MRRACIEKRTNTGLSKTSDKSPDNRPKTRRLEGGGDFPLIFFLPPAWPMVYWLPNTFSLLALMTAREEPAKRNPDSTSHLFGCHQARAKSASINGFRPRGSLPWLACFPSGAFSPAGRLTSHASLARVA
jgi:hypothetical protein